MSMMWALTRDPTLVERFKGVVDGSKAFGTATTKSGMTVLMTASGRGTELSNHPSLIAAESSEGRELPNIREGLWNEDDLLEGTASIAVWRADLDRLVLYRSRLGVPPMFFCQLDSDDFLWSTSIEDLLSLGAAREVDAIGLAQFQLAGFTQAPRTIIENVSKVPAAHRLTFGEREISLERYWSPQWSPKVHRDVHEQTEDLGRLLAAVIDEAMPDRGNVGLLLSSGIDSVCLAAVASQTGQVQAFTFEYTDYDGPYNESGGAARVANALGIPHSVIPVSPTDLMTRLPGLVRIYGEPIAYGIHSYELGPLAEAGAEVVMTGAVGATWQLTRQFSMAARLHRVVPDPILRIAHPILKDRGRVGTAVRLASSNDANRYLSMSQQVVLPPQQARRLWNDPEVVDRARAEMIEDLQRTTDPDLDVMDGFADMGLISFSAEHLLLWTHRWTQTLGLVATHPYLSSAYISYMASLANRTSDKRELRDLASRYVPDALAQTPKTAQTLPIDVWLRGPMRDYVHDHLSKSAIDSEGSFDQTTLKRLIGEHESGKANNKWELWTVLTYLLWRQEVLRP